VKDRLVSPIDSDARMGKKTGKSWTGYKGHVIVEEDTEIITAVETTPANMDDGTQLKPLLNQQEKAHSLVPGELSGDKAYDAGVNLEHLNCKRIIGYISLTKKLNHWGTDLFTVDDFKYDEAHDTLICPAGCTAAHRRYATFHTERYKRNGAVFQFTHKQCVNCRLKPRCFPADSKTHGRCVAISYYDTYYRQMKQRMESKEGMAAYRNRYKIEHKVADLARYCGMRHCRYRGLTKAKIHTLLAVIASNIKRMARSLCPQEEKPPLKMAAAC
jgi:hypothetical protein